MPPPNQDVWVEFTFVKDNTTYECACARGWDLQTDGSWKLEPEKSARKRVRNQALGRPFW